MHDALTKNISTSISKQLWWKLNGQPSQQTKSPGLLYKHYIYHHFGHHYHHWHHQVLNQNTLVHEIPHVSSTLATGTEREQSLIYIYVCVCACACVSKRIKGFTWYSWISIKLWHWHNLVTATTTKNAILSDLTLQYQTFPLGVHVMNLGINLDCSHMNHLGKQG